jgi:hypothetical protein
MLIHIADDVGIHIGTAVEDTEPAVLDSVIALLPPGFTIEVGGERWLRVVELTPFLDSLAHRCARDIDEVLHHGDFWITSDPEIVKARSSLHDCQQCRDGTASALEHLAANPTAELIVGILWWAGGRPDA